jgi:glycerol-3-phosphate acyltransferase PlsX
MLGAISKYLMNEKYSIALDAMGGDRGPSVVVPAALQVLSETTHLNIILVGDEGTLTKELSSHKHSSNPRLHIQHASQQVTMDEKPSIALRTKKDSSMRVAINMVKENKAQACVSAGNTGALMATARFVLKMLPGIDRPAIISTLPTIKGQTHMLDLGANVDTSAENLYEFAVMGSVLTSAVENIESPTVGLLNIGEEEVKGNERVKEASRLLADSDLNYIGFVEGDDIYKGTANVVVCDGFIGNVSLKTAEGVSKMISHYLREEFSRNIFTKLSGLIALPVLNALRRRIDPRSYNGASFVGLQGIVIKSHGGADVIAFASAIREAIVEVKKNVPERISKHVEVALTKRHVV